MKIIKITILLVVFLSTVKGFSQEILTKEEALAIALENNFGIKIANNNLEVAENNTSIYNRGALPTVALTSGANYSRNNQSLILTDRDTGNDAEIAGNGVVAKTYNASLGVNYTIFDGLGRKYNYQQLQKTYNLTELQAKETIENTYLQLFTVYFQIARLSENTDNLSEALTISKRRLTRAQYQYDYGQSTKLEYLNAQVDVNNDSITLITAKQQLNNAKRGLNVILGSKEDINYVVETEVDYNTMMNYNDLKNKTLENNALLKQGETNIAISEFNIKINKANFLPSLGFNASYLKNTWENYNNQLFILTAQEQNVLTNQNNFDRTQERFKLGQITSVEFRQAQINLINSKTAYNNAKFDAKLIELQLLQLSGDIMNIKF